MRRLFVGRDVRVLSAAADGLHLESSLRLSPGQPVQIVDLSSGRGRPPRDAVLWTWRLARAGSAGLEYRGFCRWVDDCGN